MGPRGELASGSKTLSCLVPRPALIDASSRPRTRLDSTREGNANALSSSRRSITLPIFRADPLFNVTNPVMQSHAGISILFTDDLLPLELIMSQVHTETYPKISNIVDVELLPLPFIWPN